MTISLVIMAAGRGSRYGGLKQLDPIGPSGETLLEYALFDARRAGFERAVLVIRAETEEAFRERLLARISDAFPVSLAFQKPAGSQNREKPWGTGHAVLAAANSVDGPFALCNADDFYGPEAFQILSDSIRSFPLAETDFALVGYPLRETLSTEGPVSRAVCQTDKDGFLTGLAEHVGIALGRGQAGDPIQSFRGHRPVSLQGDETVTMNLWGFTPAVFPLLKDRFQRFLDRLGDSPDAEFFLPDAVGGMVRKGEARVRVRSGGRGWFGLTHPGDRTRAVQRLAELTVQGVYPSPLWPSPLWPSPLWK
ncbi:MAG: NDP-sugar synthase [Desulfococcaceae bacterium]